MCEKSKRDAALEELWKSFKSDDFKKFIQATLDETNEYLKKQDEERKIPRKWLDIRNTI